MLRLATSFVTCLQGGDEAETAAILAQRVAKANQQAMSTATATEKSSAPR